MNLSLYLFLQKKQNIQKLRTSDEILEMETHQNKLVLIHQTFFDLLVKIGVSAQILMSLKHP